MFCDDPGGTFQIPFDVLGRHRRTVNDLPIDVPSVADDAQGEANFATHCFEGGTDLCYVAYSACIGAAAIAKPHDGAPPRSEEHTSELQSLMRIAYTVFRLKKQNSATTRSSYHQ